MLARALDLSAHCGWLWAVLLSVPAGWPLLGATYFASDDGQDHLFRVTGLDNALRQGILYPRVFANFAYGYGYPIFGYYGPVGYYAAELIHLLGANFTDAVKLMYALGYTLTGLFAYFLARRYVSTAPALLCATAYIYFPYHLAETYQRGAYAEHLAWIFMPLALIPITPDFCASQQSGQLAYRLSCKAAFICAGALALLIATHSLMAFIFLPVAALYFWLVTTGSLAERLRYGGLIAFGALGLSVFSWLPLVTESGWVLVSHALEKPTNLGLAPIAQWLEFTPVFQYGLQANGQAIHPLGLVNGLGLLAAIGVLVSGRRSGTAKTALAFFTGVAFLAWFMTSDMTNQLWARFAFPLGYLQYAWRFMTLTGLGCALAAALTFQNTRRLALLLIPVVLVSGLVDVRYGPVSDTIADEVNMWHREFIKGGHIGTTISSEYLPLWISEPASEIPKSIITARSVVVRESPQLTLLESDYQHVRFQVDSNVPSTVILHQFYLPQWQAKLSGAPLPVYPSGPLGLASVDIPVAHGASLDLDFGQTDLEQLEWWCAALTLAVLLLLARDMRWTVALFGVAGIYGLLIATHLQFQTVTPLDARFEDSIELIGVSTPPSPWRAGTSINVTLNWQSLRETNENLKAFIHLVDAQTGQLITQSDSAPGPFFSPTSRWFIGEIIPDHRVLTIPADTTYGHVQLYAGVYRGSPPSNLAAILNGQMVPGGSVLVADFEVSMR
jgi:hypothetical protein